MPHMAWSFEGNYFESCSCITPCPCTTSMSLGADNDYCRFLLTFDIKSGAVEGVDVTGVAVAMIGDTPKFMHEGGWKVGLWIDESASDEQAEAIGNVFSGRLGGPPAALGPLLGAFLGVERARLDVHEDGLIHSLKIGDAVDMEVEDVVAFGNEGGQPVQLTNVFHPAGSTLTVAKPTRARVSGFGIEYEGKSGFSAPFSWAG
jgi:hypothetical protein